jgi:protein-disulfide isomerase
VTIGAVVVAAAAAVVILSGPLGGRQQGATGQVTASAKPSAETGATEATNAPEADNPEASAQPALPALAGSQCPAAAGTPAHEPGQPAGATADYGIALGCDGVPGGPQAEPQVRVDVFSDYICPICQQFDEMMGAALEEAMRAGQIELVLHPLGYLDGFSTTQYSTRAARAATAVAALDPEHFGAFDQALWDAQPPEGGAGLTDAEIADLAQAAGVSAEAIAQFAGDEFANWVVDSTNLVVGTEGFNGTPWVLLSNSETAYQWDWYGETGFQQAIARVAAGQAP